MESCGEGGTAAAAAAKEGREAACAEVSVPAEALDRHEVFHVMKEIIGFVLFMHQQIPSVLQHLENEFGSLKEQHKALEEVDLTSTEVKPCSRRNKLMRIREVKQEIRRLDMLMSALTSLLTSLQFIFDKMNHFYGVILALGSSPARPQQIYEVSMSYGKFTTPGSAENGISKLAEVLSRKVIRAFLSKGAGSSSYTGPMKLFLLVKAPTTLDLSQHFLPRRDFRYNRKITPFKLHIKCKITNQGMQEVHCPSPITRSDDLLNSSSSDLIWFQCRNTVKGLARRDTTMECG